MEKGGVRAAGHMGSPPTKPSKFAVYQNPALSAALTTNSLRPSKSTFLGIFSLLAASTFAFLGITCRENGLASGLKLRFISSDTAYFLARAIQTILGSVFVASMLALIKAISLFRATYAAAVGVISPSKGLKEQCLLTKRQLGLLGIKPNVEKPVTVPSKKTPILKSNPCPEDVLVPLHQPLTSSNRSSQLSNGKSTSNSGSKTKTFGNQSKSPVSPTPFYLVPASSKLPSVKTSPGFDQVTATPWSNKRAYFTREITTEEELEHFLTDVGEKISESAVKFSTPPPTISGFGIASPVSTSANTAGTARSTPLRPVRMSTSSQKFSTPPKKGEGELPPPMSMEESVQVFEHLGIYPQIEQWRDCLRQWFSTVLLSPLLQKIETSHMQLFGSEKHGHTDGTRPQPSSI